MITLTKAISLLDKRVWVVWVPYKHYGRVNCGVIRHVAIHSPKLNRGEWSAYVSTKNSGLDYDANDIFLTKSEAETEMNKRMNEAKQ